MYPKYKIPLDQRPAHSKDRGRAVGWKDILERWDLVVADLAEQYNVNVWDPNTADLPWPWLRSLIAGLVTSDSRLSRALAPKSRK